MNWSGCSVRDNHSLPRFIRSAMKADEDAVLSAFGKNGHTKKVFWFSRVKDPRQENIKGLQT